MLSELYPDPFALASGFFILDWNPNEVFVFLNKPWNERLFL
jgi:hypothetical protein